jgi:DNA primase
MLKVILPHVEGGAGDENLTLVESELEACRPMRTQGGRRLRAFCPFHGSDNQRSLAVDIETGRFHCFACGAWGYMEWARGRWRKERANVTNLPTYRSVATKPVQPARADLTEVLRVYQAALPRSLGEQYAHSRGIPLELAQEYGLGYAAVGKWAHGARDWKWGRLVFPHADPSGQLLNLYSRAVGTNDKVPKRCRHDHLPGPKGYFNAAALASGEGPLFVTEGPFDALSLIAAGCPRTTAIFGVDGWRWEWVRKVPHLVFGLDADSRGQEAWRLLARQARLRGKAVAYLPPEAYGGYKDVNEAWMAGVFSLSR